MKSGKRILAGILSIVMLLSTVQVPGNISYAEEQPPAQESIVREGTDVQEDAPWQESGQIQEDREPGADSGNESSGEDSVMQPGTDKPEDASGESGEGKEDDPAQTETPAEGEPSGEQTPSDGEDEETPGEGEETPGEKAEDENGEPVVALPTDDVTISENDLQISGNSLMSVSEPEVWEDAEIEGAYQFGGAPSADEGIALYAESAYTDEQIMDYLYQQMKNRVTSIDVSQYDIPYETTEPSKIKLLVSGTLNEHPDLYYVGNGFSYSHTAAKIISLNIAYNTTLNASAWQNGANAALAVVNESMSDLQKAIALHDYLAVNCEYDKENLDANTLPQEVFTTYGVFVNRSAVCQGYALAYKYLLNQVGIECHMVTSDAMNHAWNLIKLDGQYYQVDVTWDDPTWDLVGRAQHKYMFCSDATFQDENHKHHDWSVTEGSSVVNYQATDTRYDNAFWADCTSPLILSDNDCYYISPNGGRGQYDKPALMKTSLNEIAADGTILQEIDKWTAWIGSGAWSGAYSGLFRIDDRLYFNDKTNIYSVDMYGTDKKTVFIADTTYGYVYGSAYYRGAVRYSLHQDPNLTAKEEVLKANIDVGGTVPAPEPESGVALNLDNLYQTYTALDGTMLTSAANGRPKLLIFYRNPCGNCQSTIYNISRSIDQFTGIDIYALESDGGTKEATEEIKKTWGCDDIIFSYDTSTKNKNSMWAYLREAGVADATVAMPVLCYIDANNRLQYITRGLKTADEVRSNLEQYCGYRQSDMVAVKAPDVTTYKVGQKINLKGGTFTYPSGSKTKTVALAANMISGFDSSKPGICKVGVAIDGYRSSFEVLIVEEPKLQVPVGKRLYEIVFPQNPHGMYIWREEDRTLDKAGVYSFLAGFIPNDAEKFQGLDVEAEVTAQETFGAGTSVDFKTNRFTYNGIEQEPKVVVMSSGVVLREGKDYELSYENNKDKGTAAVTVTGTGYYLGSIRKTFEIQPAPVIIRAKDKKILVGDPVPPSGTYEYEISGLIGTDDLLTKPSVSCAIVDTAVPGQYEIIPAGADAGANCTISYENGRLTVASEYVSCTVTFDVRGRGTAPAAQIGVKVGDTAKKPDEPTATGYRFDGWYRDEACTKAWNFDADIVQADMTLYAKWLEEGKEGGGFSYQEIGDVSYTGKACKPAVSVYDGDVLLKSGRDYQIKYYNNTNANKDGVLKRGNGEGENFNPELPYVEIIGRGNYTDRIKDGEADTVKVNFNILRTSIGDGTEQPAAGVTLKVSDQLVTAKKVQKPFSSVKYVKGMKRDVDFRLRLTAENARDQSGNSLPKGTELTNAEIPKEYEGEFLLTVEGIGNYTGSACRTVYVTDKAHLIKNTAITLGKNLKKVPFAGEAVILTADQVNGPDVFTVKYGNTFLTPRRDYTVSYRNNDKVGKAELIITGNGEYVGTKTVTFNITGRAFSAKNVQVAGLENKVYTGRALTQNGVTLTYSVKDEEPTALQYGTDYTITYAKNINRGTATMTFKGIEKAGYSGSFKKTFKIAAADISDVEQVIRAATMGSMSFPYCKAGVKPVEEIRLTNKEGFVLQNGKDYTLKYKNNKAVADASSEKPPTVTVQGKGNYAGTFDVTFGITKSGLKRAVDNGSIQIKTTAVIYNPDKAETYEYKPAVKLMDGRTALRVNTDYELRYEKNTQVDYEAYLEAYKNMANSAENAAGGETDSDSVQKLQELMPRAVITAMADSSYEADGEIVVPLPIYQTKFVTRDLQITVAEAVYTGGQVTPAVTVRDISGEKTFVEGKDYTISYGANNKSGRNKGSVTITGIAPEYGGSVTVKFEIVRKTLVY